MNPEYQYQFFNCVDDLLTEMDAQERNLRLSYL